MLTDSNHIKNNILVTGAGGFLGGELIKTFADMPNMGIRATSRRAISTVNAGYDFVQGDLSNEDFCKEVTRNIQTIIHCAALSSPWGKYSDFEKSNVIATDNLLKAAIKNGVKRFVFISSPSIYANNTDRYDIKETDDLPHRPINYYAQTKLIAEKNVLAANDNGIETLSLRPRAIIGAGDTIIFPRLINAYKQNKLKIIGDGRTVCDITCVRNVIYAIERAIVADQNALGLAYNITNCKPVRLWEVINQLLEALGHAPVTRKIPRSIAMGFAGFMEWKYASFNKNIEPPLTKFGISALSNSVTLNTDRAKELLNYKPIQTTEQGIDEFIKWYKQQHNV